MRESDRLCRRLVHGPFGLISERQGGIDVLRELARELHALLGRNVVVAVLRARVGDRAVVALRRQLREGRIPSATENHDRVQ